MIQYREREWAAILRTVEEVYEKLEWLAELGNDLLKPRLTRLLTGVSRADLIRTIRLSHDSTDIAAELRSLGATEMASFSEQSPEFFKAVPATRQCGRCGAAGSLGDSGLTGVGLVGCGLYFGSHFDAGPSDSGCRGRNCRCVSGRVSHQRGRVTGHKPAADAAENDASAVCQLAGSVARELAQRSPAGHAARGPAICQPDRAVPEFLEAANAVDRVRASAAQHLKQG